MSMPWDNPPQQPQQPYRTPVPPQQPYQAAPQTYQPPQQPYTPPPPQQPAVPVVARNPQTGEQVKMDLGPSIAQLISSQVAEALAANKDQLAANAERALRNKVQGKKPAKKPADDESALEEAEEAIEEAWTAGPVTARTLIQGLTIDIGVASLAVLTTMLTPDFNPLDVDAWLVAGSMLLKTVISTAVSFAVKVKVN